MYVYGKNVAKEMLNSNNLIKKIYLLENFNDNYLLNEINKRNINIEYIKKNKMDSIATGNNQGIVLLIDDYKYYDEDKMLSQINNDTTIVILDHLEDPHNFGAIIRTCEAAGVNYIIIPKDRSVSVNSTVMKTSAGALSNVKIVQVVNINRTIEKLKKNKVWIVGTALENSVSYDEIDYTVPVAIIIGNEGSGMSDLVKKNCDFIATIPMNGKINSLNASVAAAIMIYEVLRQRKRRSYGGKS